MVEPSLWTKRVLENPEHSTWYVERFRTMAAEGNDLAGEARFIDAMVSRKARILDAGCGPGRVGAILANAGHHVVGVDVDPVLIEAAKVDHPGPRWMVGDLAELDLVGPGIAGPFDVIVCAGNVATFLAPSTRVPVLRRFASHLAKGGRAVIGFGLGRDYELEDFDADLAAAGLEIDCRFETWSMQPFTDNSDFVVTILRTSAVD